MVRTKLAVALTLAGAMLSSSALALGLGAIEVKSALNQPLDARIPLIVSEPAELDSLSVSLASAEAFQRAGVDRPFHLTRLKFEVIGGDRPFVRVFTEQPIKEPFVDFLVEADWARGKLVREFTLLLDPPVFGGPQVVNSAPVAPVRNPVTAVAPAQGAAMPSAVPAAVGAVAPAAAPIAEVRSTTYGPVAASDTLWRIANRVRPDGSVTLSQTMVALLRANPHAFVDGDMNHLRRGAVLQVPDAATIAEINRGQAEREVRTQIDRWRRAIAAQEQRNGRLQVVAPADRGGEQVTAEGTDTKANAAFQQELRLLRESNANLEAENEELKAQVEALKQEVARFGRLLEIEAQQPVADAGEAAPAAEPNVAEPQAEQGPEAAASDVETPESEAPADAASEPVVAEEQPAAESAMPAEQPKPAEEAKPAEEVKPAAVAKPPVVTPAVEPVAAPSLLDDPRNVGVLGGVALALLGIAYLLVRRRRAAADELEPVEVAELDAVEPEPEAASEDLGEALDEEFELAASAPPAEDIPPEGDVLSEAEVYLAYGRYDQARDLLEKAVRKDPGHTAVRLKLLEVLALMQDADAYAAQARSLQAQVGEADPAWQRAVEMGRDLMPAESADLAEPALADDFAVTPAEEFAAAPVEEFATASEPAALDDFDFTLPDEPAPAARAVEEPAPQQPKADDSAFSLDFDLDLDLPAASEAPAPAAKRAPEPAAAQFDALDFEIGEPAAVEAAPAPEAAPEFDLDGFELDAVVEEAPRAASAAADNVLEFAPIDEAAAEPEGELDALDEVGVKLDLARAYLDMGDSDGARSLLDEVLEEGSGRQRQEAESLMKQIA